MLHQPPREITILKHLYNFQGVFFLFVIIYLLVLRVRAYYSPASPYITGAGAGMVILFPYFLLGIFLLSCAFFLIASGIMRGKHREIGLKLSAFGIFGLPLGILNSYGFMQSLQYPGNHVFSSADLGYLIYVICLLILGITNAACIYYLTRPKVRSFVTR